MKWIKCSERLPEEEGSYYVYNPNGFRGNKKVIYTEFIAGHGGFKTFWCPLGDQITHWMPLPDGPDEEK